MPWRSGSFIPFLQYFFDYLQDYYLINRNIFSLVSRNPFNVSTDYINSEFLLEKFPTVSNENKADNKDNFHFLIEILLNIELLPVR